MSLLPKSQQPRDDILCWPLGAAKMKPVAVKVDPNAWFDAEARKHPDDKPPKPAKKPSLRELEQAVFEKWLARVCPSGDVESVQRQWEESDEYAEFLEEHDPAPPSPATPVAVPTFKPGDRVRIACEDVPEHGMCGDYLGKSDTGYHLVKLDDGSEGCWAFDDSLELIPSEPKEADGWLQCGDDMPDLAGGLYEWKGPDGSIGRPAVTSLRLLISPEDYSKFLYRLVKQQ